MIDLRSDTVTRPTPGMREAIASAEVGDDVFGDDPTVRALERRVSELLDKPAALYVPSGSMANTVALSVLTQPGDEIVVEAFLFAGEPVDDIRLTMRSLRTIFSAIFACSPAFSITNFESDMPAFGLRLP